MHSVSESCAGEVCGPCLREAANNRVPATHKVSEETAADDPNQVRHNLTQYVCCSCFIELMGASATGACMTGGE